MFREYIPPKRLTVRHYQTTRIAPQHKVGRRVHIAVKFHRMPRVDRPRISAEETPTAGSYSRVRR